MPKYTAQQIEERQNILEAQQKLVQEKYEIEQEQAQIQKENQQFNLDNSVDGYYIQVLGDNEYGSQIGPNKIDSSYEIIMPFIGLVSPGHEIYIARNNAGVLEQRIRKENLGYKAERKLNYPSIPEQLDMIYHDIDKWKETIKQIKDLHPKGDD